MTPIRSAPARLALPPGRLTWSTGAAATVWTIQTTEVWDGLVSTGWYRATEPPDADDAYAYACRWMRSQMRERLGVLGDCAWPTWGWARIRRSDLATLARVAAGDVMLRIEIPREFTLASHFGAWHAALNGEVLYPVELSDESADAEYARWKEATDRQVTSLGGSPDRPILDWSTDAQSLAQHSWERIFDHGSWKRADTLQCVMPRIDLDWVADAVEIA